LKRHSSVQSIQPWKLWRREFLEYVFSICIGEGQGVRRSPSAYGVIWVVQKDELTEAAPSALAEFPEDPCESGGVRVCGLVVTCLRSRSMSIGVPSEHGNEFVSG
jgi:hypothetical protein